MFFDANIENLFVLFFRFYLIRFLDLILGALTEAPNNVEPVIKIPLLNFIININSSYLYFKC